MKKLFALIMIMILMLPPAISAQEEIVDFEGRYLTEENSNIMGFEIEEDLLKVILGRSYFGQAALEGDYSDALLQLYTESINQDGRLMMVKTDEAAESLKNQQYINLRFSDEVPMAVEIIVHNPTYRIKDQKLTIFFADKELFSFELNEESNLVDEEGNQFMLKEKD
ncbi:hypothetical protein [Facklamia sp. P12932]|uniref:hypothetical protein n=1 Tax=Facklamia sp. P12932 TaxID=3421947 RepID=UPI003D17D733